VEAAGSRQDARSVCANFVLISRIAIISQNQSCKTPTAWKIYRTRFLINARQLTQPLFFVDALGREHRGQPGDYLVESSDGARRIAPRLILEDLYVAMGPAGLKLTVSFQPHKCCKPGLFVLGKT
jgi:hypothetical protein